MSAATGRTLWALATGYVNLGVTALVSLLLIPLYARLLDAQQWGIVATCMTVHGLLFALDIALAPLVVRDVAQSADARGADSQLRRFLRLYLGCGLLAVLVAECVVAGGLLFANAERADDIRALLLPLQFALLSFLLQFTNAALIGYWSGKHRQALANLRTAAFTVLKHSFALASVLLVDHSALGYLVPFALGSLVELAANLFVVGRAGASVIRDRDEAQQPAQAAASSAVSTRREEIGLLIASSGLAVAVSQVDRVLLSWLLSTREFGAYYLVSYVIAAILTLQMPIARTFLPRIAGASDATHAIRAMYRASLWLLLLPCAIGIVIAPLALQIWLPPGRDSDAAVLPLRLMLAGVMLIVLYAPLSNFLFSRRRYRDLLFANLSSLVVQVVILLTLSAPLGGLLAGGLSWFGCGLTLLIYALIVMRRTPEIRAVFSRRGS